MTQKSRWRSFNVANKSWKWLKHLGPWSQNETLRWQSIWNLPHNFFHMVLALVYNVPPSCFQYYKASPLPLRCQQPLLLLPILWRYFQDFVKESQAHCNCYTRHYKPLQQIRNQYKETSTCFALSADFMPIVCCRSLLVIMLVIFFLGNAAMMRWVFIMIIRIKGWPGIYTN